MAALIPPTPLVFEANSLYLLIRDRGDTYVFLWSLYLTTTATEGIQFHIVNDVGPTDWKYERTSKNEILCLHDLLVALKIGVVGPTMHGALSDRLALVPLTLYSTRFRENLSCRVWVKEALFALDDEGYLNLEKTVQEIEEEATYLAMMAKSKGNRKVMRSATC
ncbi:uncharacterized protein N7477_005642 [Penicillium maclennaniae]|uniref:uncharacterized protein n=1 Tax=Penicillium maclennaniae TaxID=1343394 RepID=UPI002540349D|nr:uncharacterized protein N7477_005642 [Penicillium maclennaniae]KAJ5670279.1 hypothetical protein N7477_005642 [Penicillium maclennaniae]